MRTMPATCSGSRATSLSRRRSSPRTSACPRAAGGSPTRAIAAGIGALTALLTFAPAAHAGALSPQSGASPNADEATAAYWVMFVIGAVVVVAANAALIAAAVRFRARRGREPARVRGGRRLQSRAAAALAVLAAVVFVVGVVTAERSREVEASGSQGLEASSGRTAQASLSLPDADAEPLRILASGQQWVWRYEYPDGTFSYYELVVPVDTTVLLRIDSTDVTHRWWIPELGGKFDAVPGRINQTWFQADREGTYEGRSAAFSGPGYATMRARVRVVSVPEYEAWLERQSEDIQEAQEAVQRRVERQLEAEGAAADEAEGAAADEAEAADEEAAQ